MFLWFEIYFKVEVLMFEDYCKMIECDYGKLMFMIMGVVCLLS